MKHNRKNKWIKIELFILCLALMMGTFPWWIRTFYPQPHQMIVHSCSTAYQLDPLLVYALIRCESRYQEQVESSAGAVGLMQLMPETAAWLAEKEGMEFSKEQLKIPYRNIELGCAYLSWLMQEFEGRLPVVLAAYNAGHGRVEDWLGRNIWDGNTENLQQIPFKETRNYVKTVLKTYQVYQMIDKMKLDV